MKSNGIPPLSQSRHGLLACDLLYSIAVIEGAPAPPNEFTLRGRQIHQFTSEYINHLVKTKQKTDLAFVKGYQGLIGDAFDIKEKIGERLIIDPEKVWGTEVHIVMDREFKARLEWPLASDYEMTLDLITLHDEHTAEITDWKSYFQVTDPDTFQARLYSLGLMMLNPNLQKVIFRLEFVRWGVGKSEVFTREDIPRLQEEARNYRARQVMLHQDPAMREATAGNHCRYCPRLAVDCPLDMVLRIEKNTPAELTGLAVYHKLALGKIMGHLREVCKEAGPQSYDDKTGHTYRAEWGTHARKSYPLPETVIVLHNWAKTAKEDLMPKLTVSGLSSPLKAKKRADLADELANVAVMNTSGRFNVGLVKDDGETEDDDEHGER